MVMLTSSPKFDVRSTPREQSSKEILNTIMHLNYFTGAIIDKILRISEPSTVFILCCLRRPPQEVEYSAKVVVLFNQLAILQIINLLCLMVKLTYTGLEKSSICLWLIFIFFVIVNCKSRQHDSMKSSTCEEEPYITSSRMSLACANKEN